MNVDLRQVRDAFKFVLMLAFALTSPFGAVVAITVVGFAKWRVWPQMPFRMFWRGWRLLLPVTSWLGAAVAVMSWHEFFGVRPSISQGISGGIVAALCAAFVILILEKQIMTSIFRLVPEEQQQQLDTQLSELDETQKGAEGQAADLSHLDPAAVVQRIEQRVIGQDVIVESAVKTAFRRARLARPKKPVGVLLFVGATGAGKTELAKALAAELFDDRLIRVDCNELSAEQNVQRLIGPPPGYIGADKGGQLCRDLGRMGTGVLLLDEVEKAHPSVLKVLMGLLDEARLTEQSSGTTYSARGFLVVLTSNAAAEQIAKVGAVENDPTLRGTKTKDALQDAGFLPEVLARIDAVFPFRKLASRDVARVIERFLLQFAADVGVELVEADADLLYGLVMQANKTRDYGIREVVRSVENAVVDGLIEAKDIGARQAAIRVHGGKVHVVPRTDLGAAVNAMEGVSHG